jgi:hypothetical protein
MGSGDGEGCSPHKPVTRDSLRRLLQSGNGARLGDFITSRALAPAGASGRN